MADAKHYDVVIIGAGIAGSALALGLSGLGLSIAVVEAQTPGPPSLPEERDVQYFDSRVSALTPRSRDFLHQLGAWEAIAGYRECAYRHMTVWDADGTGRVEFDCRDVDAPVLGHIVENRAIVASLLDRIGAAPDIQLFTGAGLQACQRDDQQVLQLTLANGTRLEADLLVAADGALSAVRDFMGFRTPEWDYGHRAIVATVEVSASHEHTAWQRFLPTGPLALLPLPGTAERHFCSIVWSIEESRADALLALDDTAFAGRLARASEYRLGEILQVSPRAGFPLRQRHAVDYVQSGVALVADAAHTIHPLAGQGINLGLADVAVLCEEITRGVAQGVNPGELRLLRRYQRRRKGDNLLMMTAMDGFKHLFAQRSPAVRWLRNAGMRRVDALAPLKQQIMRHAMGLGA
ncbi:MAG: UbiH/UbiF/VisC/COQ6 family ubiquinone biosynthesis hydroxylase [Halioglobus sp.]|nr:UbiH/UbiF/VisC/COQ6 family ubiquinone biosynthesis hydroxylase [Halioglobus sp.]